MEENNIIIQNSNNKELLLTEDFVGSNISLTLEYTDSKGFNHSINSNVIQNIEHVNNGSALVTISGITREEQELSINLFLNDPDGMEIYYKKVVHINGLLMMKIF